MQFLNLEFDVAVLTERALPTNDNWSSHDQLFQQGGASYTRHCTLNATHPTKVMLTLKGKISVSAEPKLSKSLIEVQGMHKDQVSKLRIIKIKESIVSTPQRIIYIFIYKLMFFTIQYVATFSFHLPTIE